MALSYYDILGIDPEAGETEIRRAYRRAVKEVHPDHNPNDERSARRSRELNAALETLLDPQKKARYDRLLERRSARKKRQSNPSTGTAGPEKKTGNDVGSPPKSTPAKNSAGPERESKASSFSFGGTTARQTESRSKKKKPNSELPPFEQETYVDPPEDDDVEFSWAGSDSTSDRGTKAPRQSQGVTPPYSPRSSFTPGSRGRVRASANHSLWLGIGLGVSMMLVLVGIVVVGLIVLRWAPSLVDVAGGVTPSRSSPQSFNGRQRFPRPLGNPSSRTPSVTPNLNQRSDDLLKSLPELNGKRAIDFVIVEGRPESRSDGIQLLQFPSVRTTRAYEFRLKIKRVSGDGKLVIGTPIMGQAVAVTFDDREGNGYVSGVDHVRSRGGGSSGFHVMGRGQSCPVGRVIEISIKATMLGPTRQITVAVEGRLLGSFEYRGPEIQNRGEIADMVSSSVYVATQDAGFRIEGFDYVR